MVRWKNKSYPIRCIDGFCMHIHQEKRFADYIILKCSYFPENDIVYIASKNHIFAHGATIRKAIEDLQFKIMENTDISAHIARIAKQGTMTANDYRLLTGACREGTDHFLQAHNLTWEDTMPVEEVLKLTDGFYGHEIFKEAAKEILSYQN